MGPITNYELGKMLHREYEAEVSRHWGQQVTNEEKSGPAKVYELVFALTSIILTALLLVRLLPL